MAILLGGSYARGEATPYSDVDIAHLVAGESLDSSKQYRYHDGRLISVATRTIAWYRAAVAQPERAIFIVPSLLEARILVDKDHAFRTFRSELQVLTWTPLQEAANLYASRALANEADTVHKLLSASARNDTATMFACAALLYFNVTLIVAVQRGRRITSDRSYVQHVHEAAGLDSPWTKAHQRFIDLDTSPSLTPLIQARSIAALDLYWETFKLLQPMLQANDHALIEQTVATVDGALTAIIGQQLWRSSKPAT